MKQEYLSDIELYFSSLASGNNVVLTDAEFKHATKVMRHGIGDFVYVTNGKGNIFECTVTNISKTEMNLAITKTFSHENRLENVTFCFPRLKSSDRFEFEIEKAVELGITNFIIINTERTIPKGQKIERWNKIAISAMKQSLNPFLPKIEYLNSFSELNKIKGRKIILDQKSEKGIIEYYSGLKNEENLYFIFGPEGGLSEKELNMIANAEKVRLTPNRLRAETAVIAVATVIGLI